MIRPGYDEIQSLSKEYSVVPVSREIYADRITPIALLSRISQISQKFYLLESMEGVEQWGRYSFMGFSPILQVKCKADQVTVYQGEHTSETKTKKPLTVLREILKDYRSPKINDMPPFTGGFVGYFSYELIKYAEPVLKLKESEFQDFDVMLFDKVIAYDHLKQKIHIIVNMKTDDIEENYKKAIKEIDTILGLIQKPFEFVKEEMKSNPVFTSNTTREEYYNMVEKTKEYILDGDIFQAVVSRRFEAEYRDSLFNAYRILRTANPSPYMVFLQNEELQLISTSPETLVKQEGDKLTSFPIAGSRPRGATKEEDMKLEEELLKDEKELSEHNMLVDLARNDIGKISEYTSVHLTEYKNVYKYSKIMHITSAVEGRLKKGLDSLDVIETVLPAGTLSGAPKIRACQIIDELEKEPRGIYGGAIGYIDFSGNMDTCIAIRMAVKKNDKVYIQAGAGIVADSVPKKEYEETEHKAKAVMEAILRGREVEEE